MPLERPIDTPADAVREVLAPLRNDFSVALVGPGNAFAVGGVIRVAHSFLAREIIVVGDGAWYAKASMGMHKYERVVRIGETEAFLRAVRGRPLWAFEKDHARRSIGSVTEFPKDVVLVFGSERFGIPPDVLEAADEIVGIPIYGINHSLPLVVAAGIAMHEWARRHYADGACG
jgi:tRNA G18 (ribose-2'-O)-methylase SpoU